MPRSRTPVGVRPASTVVVSPSEMLTTLPAPSAQPGIGARTIGSRKRRFLPGGWTDMGAVAGVT